MTVYHAEWAWLGGGDLTAGVNITVSGGVITDVAAGPSTLGSTVLYGVTLPAFIDAHSHAFHRALRSHTHDHGGDFWTWRTLMYQCAERLDPDRYEALATAVYAEAALAGFGTVGEFHYLHHAAGGTPYDNPNAMGRALVRAADRAGVRLVLLDTLYLRSDFDRPLEGVQRRFGDADPDAWAERVTAFAGEVGNVGFRLGVAAHSVRAVPPEALAVVADVADGLEATRHIHLSEQPAENESALAATGKTPTQLIADAGLVGPALSVVHATHLTAADVGILGSGGGSVVMCPTTEADLGDGLGYAADLVEAGAGLSIGTDSHATVDSFEEMRRIEHHDRMRLHQRGVHAPADLLAAGTTGGATALGRPAAGIAPGAPADLVTVSLDSHRFAGSGIENLLPAVVFSGSADDVRSLIVGGRRVVENGVHTLVENLADRLDGEIRSLLEDA